MTANEKETARLGKVSLPKRYCLGVSILPLNNAIFNTHGARGHPDRLITRSGCNKKANKLEGQC